MGDLPRWKMQRFWRDNMIGLEDALFRRWELKGALKRKTDRAWRGTRAQRRTRKDVGLENALPKR
jgi:hypothetical protein